MNLSFSRYLNGNLFWMTWLLVESQRQASSTTAWARLGWVDRGLGLFVVLLGINCILFCLEYVVEAMPHHSPFWNTTARFPRALANALMSWVPLVLLFYSPGFRFLAHYLGEGLAQGWRIAQLVGTLGGTGVLLRFALRDRSRIVFPLWLGRGSFALALVFTGLVFVPRADTQRDPQTKPTNVLLLTVDGLNTDRLSLLGAGVPTTPFLQSIGSELLIAPHGHAPASDTHSSIAALLTGRNPVETGLTSPAIMVRPSERGRDFLALMQKQGYQEIFSRQKYGNATSMWIGNRATGWRGELDQGITQLNEFGLRAFARVVSIFPRVGWSWLLTPKLDATYVNTDRQRIDRMLGRIASTSGPFLSHLHLMTTHCCNYELAKRYFLPPGETPEEPLGYDDAVRNVDDELKYVFEFLQHRKILDQTIVVIASDHPRGRDRSNYFEIPILIRFPEGKHAGVVKRLVTLEDVAPTLLEYLGQARPEWLQGYSLLQPQAIPRDRVITGVCRRHFINEHLNQHDGLSDPLLGIETLSVVGCGRWSFLDPAKMTQASSGVVKRMQPADCTDKGDFMPRALSSLGSSVKQLQREVPTHRHAY